MKDFHRKQFALYGVKNAFLKIYVKCVVQEQRNKCDVAPHKLYNSFLMVKIFVNFTK